MKIYQLVDGWSLRCPTPRRHRHRHDHRLYQHNVFFLYVFHLLFRTLIFIYQFSAQRAYNSTQRNAPHHTGSLN